MSLWIGSGANAPRDAEIERQNGADKRQRLLAKAAARRQARAARPSLWQRLLRRKPPEQDEA